MENRVIVSVVMPCYNSERFIEESILSVLHQSFQDFELIIVDNGSSDKSLEIIEKYASQDSRISLFFSDNGAALARQKGIEVSSGKYIAFLDTDDLWHEDKLKYQTDFMEQHKLDFSYHPYTLLSDEGKQLNQVREVPERITYESQLKGNRIGCLTVMYRRDVTKDTAIPNLQKRNDSALWLKILKNVKEGKRLNKNLAYYRVSDESLSSGPKARLLKYHYRLYRESEKFSVLKSIYYVIWNIYVFIDISRNWLKKQY